MKTPQRQFVVERKSGRRRLTTQPASIWGDTDLKALVRKAEADAPHLFEPMIVSDTAGHDSALRPESGSEPHHNDETEAGAQQPVVDAAVEAEQNFPPQQEVEDRNFSSVPERKAASLKLGSPKVAKPRRVSTGNRQIDGINVAPPMRSTAARVEVPADELVALDHENRHLKGLLAQHFREQNMRLRTMLARFGVS